MIRIEVRHRKVFIALLKYITDFNICKIDFITLPLLMISNTSSKTEQQNQQIGFISPLSVTRSKDSQLSSLKQLRRDLKRSPKYLDTETEGFIKKDGGSLAATLPPRAVPFRRSRDNSKERGQQIRQKSGQLKYISRVNDSETKNDERYRIISLEKRLKLEASKLQKTKEFSNHLQEKVKELNSELTYMKQINQKINQQLKHNKEELRLRQRKLQKANEMIETLNKSANQNKITQKSLINLNAIQAQIQSLKKINEKLFKQNQQLQNKIINNSHQNEEVNKDHIRSLQFQLHRLKRELIQTKSVRQQFLQNKILELQKQIFQKDNMIKQVTIQLNIKQRKKSQSIDQIKAKKDSQLKELKQKLIKMSKDLKQSKSKIQKDKKTPTKVLPPLLKKVRSSKNFGSTSQSEQITFQLSLQV